MAPRRARRAENHRRRARAKTQPEHVRTTPGRQTPEWVRYLSLAHPHQTTSRRRAHPHQTTARRRKKDTLPEKVTRFALNNLTLLAKVICRAINFFRDDEKSFFDDPMRSQDRTNHPRGEETRLQRRPPASSKKPSSHRSIAKGTTLPKMSRRLTPGIFSLLQKKLLILLKGSQN